jgi:hypothetical protein|nr:TonB-dependent receptor [Kofleriaceae bacterium]
MAGVASAQPADGSGSDAGSASAIGPVDAGSGDSGSGSGSDVVVPVTLLDCAGRIIDALGVPVIGADVSVDGHPEVAASKTDRRGRFHLLHVPQGSSVVVQKAGYQTGLAIASATELDDTVLLSEKQASETIEVHSEGPPAAAGAAKLDRSEIERMPGTGNDLVRTLSAMPGVVNSELPLGYSGVVIRGSSPQDSKILIDDFEVPVLYHDIGFRSIVPTEAIDKLDYIPGGFDVAYGRASSGIVSLTTRPGSDKTTEQAEVSVIDGGVIAQGTDGDLKYMVAFRRSLIDLILPEIIPASADISLTTVPRYYDGQLRVDYKLNPRWDLKLSSIGSDDLLEIFADKAQNADKRFYNRTRFDRTTATARYHDGPWVATMALSAIAQEFVFDIGALQHIDVQQPSVTARGEVSYLAREWSGLHDVLWRAGAEAAIGRASLDLALPQEVREGQPMGNFNPKDTTETFIGNIWTPDFAAWTSVAANLDPQIKATVGLRVDEFERVHDLAIEPRSELAYKFLPQWTARLSAGEYVRPPEYQSELLDTGVKGEHATQSIAGVAYEPKEGIRFQGSLYYTDRFDLITYAADGKTLTNDGRGTTYGAELLGTLRDGPWFGFLSYSYSHSTRVDQPGDPERLFDFDQPHSLNVAVSHRWVKWQLGGRFQLYSGLPLTPVVGSVFASDANTYVPVYGAVNSDRAPMHTQLDLRLDHYFKWGPVDMSWFIDVQNVYLEQSTVAFFYSYDYSQRAAFSGLPIIPSIGVRGTL